MRWPSPRAQTAQPERWRMRRWSKEPRRMSVVKGRVEVSLARASRVLSLFLIYIHETIKDGLCQDFSKQFYEILFFYWNTRLPVQRASTDRTDDACTSVRKSETRFFPL